jgi:hypothetical protein
MDPRLHSRRTEIHAAELARQAELHRMVVGTRASERSAKSISPSRLGRLAGAIGSSTARVRTLAHGIPKLGSKANRA